MGSRARQLLRAHSRNTEALSMWIKSTAKPFQGCALYLALIMGTSLWWERGIGSKEVTLYQKKFQNRLFKNFLFILFLSFADCYLFSLHFIMCPPILPSRFLQFLMHDKVLSLASKFPNNLTLTHNLKFVIKEKHPLDRMVFGIFVCEFWSSHIWACKNNLRCN